MISKQIKAVLVFVVVGTLAFISLSFAHEQDEPDDAHSAFLVAQAIDPGFAMAIWGEAMTFNHPLWAQQDREEALKALAKLGPRGSLRATEHEQRYLDAVVHINDQENSIFSKK